MAAGQYDNSVDSQSYLVAPDLNGGMYDGTSSESSASSPLNCNVSFTANIAYQRLANKGKQGFDNLYGANGFMPYPAFPMQYPMNGEGMTPMGLIPVELDIEGLYEDHDRRRRKNGGEKSVSSHVHSVSSQILTPICVVLIFHSVVEPRIAHHNEHSETGKKSICANSSNV